MRVSKPVASQTNHAQMIDYVEFEAGSIISSTSSFHSVNRCSWGLMKKVHVWRTIPIGIISFLIDITQFWQNGFQNVWLFVSDEWLWWLRCVRWWCGARIILWSTESSIKYQYRENISLKQSFHRTARQDANKRNDYMSVPFINMNNCLRRKIEVLSENGA